jgi:hypothetical protein
MSLVRDGFALAGVALALYGLALWSVPLTCVVGGVLLVVCSIGWAAFGRNP